MRNNRKFVSPNGGGNGNGNGRSDKRTADRKRFGDIVKAARESAGFANCNALIKALNHKKITLAALCALEAGRSSSFPVSMIYLLAEKTDRKFVIEPSTIEWNQTTTLGQLLDQNAVPSLVPLPKKG